MRKLLLLLLIICPAAFAQTTYTAADCTQPKVLIAVNNELASSVDGDIIAIPACPGGVAWTTNITPTFTKNVTIQGAGAISSTTSGGGTTGTDQTLLINHSATAHEIMYISTTVGKVVRFTGISVQEDSGSSGSGTNGNVAFSGPGQVRVDHCHFVVFVNGSKGVGFFSGITGVADHDYINTAQSVTNNMIFENGGTWNGDNGGYGNGSWADSDHYGTGQFIYVEDSLMVGGYISDCALGGRYVLRHSTFTNTNGQAEHGTHLQDRGCRASESYLNTFSTPAGTTGGTGHNNSGASLVWSNAVTGFTNAIDLNYYRITGVPFGFPPAPPNGFGGCGAVTNGPSTWDQNTGSNGYACLDLPGRGQGDLLTNYSGTFSTVLNSTTGTRVWPHQALSPVYAWNNTLGGAGASAIIGNGVSILSDNRDYYMQFGTFGEGGTFNGTSGIGQGTLVPTNGSAYTGAPNCSSATYPGPGYWDTTNNTLYVCTAINTWTAYYTPYIYPHPLAGGTPTCANPTITPGSEIFFNTFNATITAVCTSIIYTTNGTTPTASGVCAAINGTLYTVPISISTTTTLSAIACQSGSTTSGVTIANYTLSTPAPAVNMLMGSLWLNPVEGK